VAAATCDDEVCALNVVREVNAVAMSPDARQVALGLQDHTLQVWDIGEKVLVHVFRGHRNWVNAVAWSPDGARLASGGADKTIRVWSAWSPQCESTLQGHLLSVNAVAFSEDALRLASGSWDKTVCIWDVEQGKALVVLNGHTDWVHSVAWAPGGRQLASASSDHSVRVWNAVTGVAELVLLGHLQTVSSVSFARNGIFLASGSLDRTVRIWNVQEGALVARLQQDSDEGSVHCVAFMPDSDRVVVGCGDRHLKVWGVRSGDLEGQLSGHEEAVCGVAASFDGQRLVSCSHDLTVRVWRTPPRRPRTLPGTTPPPAALAGAAVAEGLLTPSLPSLPLAGGGAGGPTGASFKELADRLRFSEDTNQRLRQQLSEVQFELEESASRLRRQSSSATDQESKLVQYREMISNLTAEKERLERSFDEMRRELRLMPNGLAGSGVPSGPVGCGRGV